MRSVLFRKADVMIIIFLIVFGVLLFVLLGKGDGRTAIIEYNGKTLKTIDLNSVKNEYTLEIDGDVNVVLTVSKGGICFSHSECPDKICMDFGVISKPGEIAVCAVAKVSVRISGSSSVDGVTG